MTAVRLERDGDVALLVVDVPGEPVNTLSSSAITDFEALLDAVASDTGVRAVVLISGKPNGFIAGADISEFTQLTTQEAAEALAGRGQAVMDRVAAFPKPIVAAIHGACLGGGTELVLACAWRIATDDARTQIGLPEVQLGLLPGAGGCNRLPRLIGVRAALDIILAGRSERAAKARKIGLVDELCAAPILRRVAVQRARALAGAPPRRRALSWPDRLLGGTAPGRAFLARQALGTLRKKSGGHYPAPEAALEVVLHSLAQGMTSGLALERRRFGELAVTAVSRNLVQLFFASTALKKDTGLPDGVVAAPHPVRRLGVVGAGFMGAGIAGTAALHTDADVRLRDAEHARVGRGVAQARRILDDRLKRRHLTKQEHARRTAALSGGIDLRGFEAADLAIEAVFEDLAVKRQVLAELQGVMRPGSVVATNTSTIPIARIADGAARPADVLGMHFFSPVEKMPLLEVIPHAGTAPDAIATAVTYGRALGKTVIVVADRPGFWVNRILFPYLNEAGHLLEEGVPVELLDRTVTAWGFPVGPITLMDEVGLDVAVKAAAVMHEAFGERMRPGSLIAKLVADGRLGRKNGRGFYRYEDGRRAGVDPALAALVGASPERAVDAKEAETRLIFAMLNESAHALGDGVVRSARDGDLGAIFGIGFPPFRGGPLRVLDAIGAAAAVATLEQLAERHGPRFAPAPLLRELARRGARFHDD
jgi:3-hydroxyacyl-CoA dehydrogenase/enoyl-CoA hydratase/3-hydroxybutyryl-CoA epimerase